MGRAELKSDGRGLQRNVDEHPSAATDPHTLVAPPCAQGEAETWGPHPRPTDHPNPESLARRIGFQQGAQDRALELRGQDVHRDLVPEAAVVPAAFPPAADLAEADLFVAAA